MALRQHPGFLHADFFWGPCGTALSLAEVSAKSGGMPEEGGQKKNDAFLSMGAMKIMFGQNVAFDKRFPLYSRANRRRLLPEGSVSPLPHRQFRAGNKNTQRYFFKRVEC